MNSKIRQESFDSLTSYWTDTDNNLRWGSVFVLPEWLRVWWEELGTGGELYLNSYRLEDKVIGIAPLQIKNDTASFIGSADVCDYIDFITAPDREEDFFNILIDDLLQIGIKRLDLRPVRPDSTVLNSLARIVEKRGYSFSKSQEDVSVEMGLPSTWDEYLSSLDKKQRHEVRRKLRRLYQAGKVNYRCTGVKEEVSNLMNTFFELFSLSRGEKGTFMTEQMEGFFRALIEAMAEIKLLRFGIIELENVPTAMTLGFDYNNSHYLYNSAYDPQFDSLSAGLASKMLCIKESIEQGKNIFDFLKGEETYKYQLGGTEIPIYNCQLTIS